jgi:hypothetical protein
MNIQDKIENWSMQLEQAQQYGLHFDWQTVKEMIETIKELTEDNKILKNAYSNLDIKRDMQVKKLQEKLNLITRTSEN